MTKDEPIDLDALLARCLGDAAFVREILGVFHEQAKVHLAELREKVRLQEIEASRRLAHAMKGSSANLSAAYLSMLCGRLEQSALDGSLAGADVKLVDISTELDRVVAFFPTVHARLG